MPRVDHVSVRGFRDSQLNRQRGGGDPRAADGEHRRRAFRHGFAAGFWLDGHLGKSSGAPDSYDELCVCFAGPCCRARGSARFGRTEYPAGNQRDRGALDRRPIGTSGIVSAGGVVRHHPVFRARIHREGRRESEIGDTGDGGVVAVRVVQHRQFGTCRVATVVRSQRNLHEIYSVIGAYGSELQPDAGQRIAVGGIASGERLGANYSPNFLRGAAKPAIGIYVCLLALGPCRRRLQARGRQRHAGDEASGNQPVRPNRPQPARTIHHWGGEGGGGGGSLFRPTMTKLCFLCHVSVPRCLDLIEHRPSAHDSRAGCTVSNRRSGPDSNPSPAMSPPSTSASRALAYPHARAKSRAARASRPTPPAGHAPPHSASRCGAYSRGPRLDGPGARPRRHRHEDSIGTSVLASARASLGATSAASACFPRRTRHS